MAGASPADTGDQELGVIGRALRDFGLTGGESRPHRLASAFAAPGEPITHSLRQAVRDCTRKPASSAPSSGEACRQTRREPVKLRMQKLSSQSRGHRRRSCPTMISTISF